ncbi:integrase [Desulfurococcus amylolyticus]|uniref:integrase n=1 Tax=Desulfurococcus amylolyticus TaxID=94694 RepID=UPI001F1D320C|nr:integrase [Desulfurococcus amylolyticus]
MSEFNSQPGVSAPWFTRVSVKGLSDDSRRVILHRVKDKLGFNKAVEVLGVSKGALHNYLHGLRRIPDEVVSKALQHLTEAEFKEIVQGVDRLRALGIVRSDGSVDYSLILQAIALAHRDEYLKHALLKFVVENFREDLKKMLGVSYAHVKFTWEKGFEEFLSERKKRRKVRDPETISYYRNLFKKYLEGRELSEELVDYVINHENKWLRNVFRHYVQYLYYKRAVSPEVYGWLMEVVPSRSYKIDVRPYPINAEDLAKTMGFLRTNHEKYYLVYKLMLEGGLRLSHALTLIETFNPGEVIEVPGVGLETKRLVCLHDKGFCRYYLGVKDIAKPCEWVYFSLNTLRLLEKYRGSRISRRVVEKFVRGHGLLAPKYMRKASWRLMIQVMPREVARFIQSRFGELKVSEARYEDLLGEADKYYPAYLGLLSKAFTTLKQLNQLER